MSPLNTPGKTWIKVSELPKHGIDLKIGTIYNLASQRKLTTCNHLGYWVTEESIRAYFNSRVRKSRKELVNQ